MANGSEANSVLEQQTTNEFFLSDQEKERTARVKAIHMREVQTLELSCARVREQMQRSHNARYSEMLERELRHLEKELARLQ
jgi:transcription initiation factor IIE alpha subunit